MKRILLSLALIGLTVLGFSFQTQERTEIVSVPKTEAFLKAAARLELDLLSEKDGRIYVVASPADLRLIEDLGLTYKLETRSFAPAKPAAESPFAASPIGAFHTGQELGEDLNALEAQYPQLAKVVQIGTSLENRPILALKISDNPGADEGEPAVLFLGCHHAREWISVEVPFLLGKHLLENYASNPEVRRLVDAAEIWIVPMVNPDGHDYTVRVYRYWRKNRRDNENGTFGVDLNRNYGYAWGYDNRGSSPLPWSDVYRGTAAFSEPETQAVRDLVLSRNFGSLISYHSFAQNIMYPWGYQNLPTARDETFAALGAALAERIKAVNGRIYLSGRASETMYLTNGDTLDWSYALTGLAGFTIELSPVYTWQGAFVNGEEDIEPIFRDNLPAMLYLIDWTIAHPNPVPESSLIFPRPIRPEPRRTPGVIK